MARTETDTFVLVEGEAPLLVSFPHDGLEIPAQIEQRLTPEALALPDTDWHVARLYDFVVGLGASALRARMSRYVVDLNRDPSGTSLYPGADNTELCPTTTFAREPIYQEGQALDPAEVPDRVARFHRPYHAALGQELERLRARHGVAVLLDAHSIRSEVPRFFEGVLPDLNLGTAAGQSANEELAVRAFAALDDSAYSVVRDGRFQGGYITRQYGKPEQGVHAVQLEIAQRIYMAEGPPFRYSFARADALRPVLDRFVRALIGWATEQAR